jgi:flagellar biosynthesis protein FliP
VISDAGREVAKRFTVPPAARVPVPLPTLRERIVAAMPPPARTRRRRWLRRGVLLFPVVMVLGCVLWPAIASAAPGINLNLDSEDGEVSTSLQLLALLTVLSLAPSILIMMTSFTRIIIVLGFVRNALGTPSMPPNQVLVGIALFLSLFVMGPTFTQINDEALQPLLEKRIDEGEAIKRAEAPIRAFMFEQVDQRDLALFTELSDGERPETRADVPTTVLIPAFVLSELKTAFEIGFLILIPFLIIDMVIASTVMSMGMVMLPPVVISLPFKVLLFVLVDGWHLVSESLVRGFA